MLRCRGKLGAPNSSGAQELERARGRAPEDTGDGCFFALLWLESLFTDRVTLLKLSRTFENHPTLRDV